MRGKFAKLFAVLDWQNGRSIFEEGLDQTRANLDQEPSNRN